MAAPTDVPDVPDVPALPELLPEPTSRERTSDTVLQRQPLRDVVIGGVVSGSRRHEMLLAIERRLTPIRPRRALLAAGRMLSHAQLAELRVVLGALTEGQWLAGMTRRVPCLPDRFAVFDAALQRITGDSPLYLEFGVFRGRTLRWWTQHLTPPTARFVGFDSFEGLPEAWRRDVPGGYFDAGGLPAFDDPRVSLVAGWFDQTLPTWTPPPHDQLIVNVDCDLYASTRCVLTWLEPYLRPGTLVYFDDLLDCDAELRAMQEWAERHEGQIEPLAMARWGQHLLVQVR
jgi:Methyltransferase domain